MRGGGGGFYCTTEASSLIREVHPLSNVLFSWDVRGNYSTKSKVAECVKRLHFGCVFELLGTFEISQNFWGVGWGRVNHDKHLPFHSDKINLKFIFISFKTKSYTEKVCNISKSPIETYRKYTFCVHMHTLHPGANKFAPHRK